MSAKSVNLDLKTPRTRGIVKIGESGQPLRVSMPGTSNALNKLQLDYQDDAGYMTIETGDKEPAVDKSTGEAVAIRYSTDEWKQKMRSIRVGRPVGKGGKRGSGTVRTWIVQSLAFSTAANTAFALSTNMSPASSADYSSFSSVYDEVKVHGFRAVCTYNYGPFSTDLNARTVIALNYDPVDATAQVSVVNALTSKQHAGPWLITSPYLPAATQNIFQPGQHEVSSTKGGFHTFRYHVPPGSSRSSVNNLTFGDEWASTGDAGDYWGFLKTYIEAGGTAGVINARYFIFYDLSFRSRT